MYLIILLLYKEDLMEDFLSLFVETGIHDAIVINGTSFAHSLAYEVPIFAGLRTALEQNRSFSHVIFGYAKDEYRIRQMIDIAKTEGIDLDKPGIGLLMAVPITLKFGVEQELTS